MHHKEGVQPPSKFLTHEQEIVHPMPSYLLILVFGHHTAWIYCFHFLLVLGITIFFRLLGNRVSYTHDRISTKVWVIQSDSEHEMTISNCRWYHSGVRFICAFMTSSTNVYRLPLTPYPLQCYQSMIGWCGKSCVIPSKLHFRYLSKCPGNEQHRQA